MKIEIRNLGVVQQAEIDLKPLTIFVGPNNTGKTWVANTLLAVLGSYGWNRYLKAYAAGELEDEYPPLDAAIQQLVNEGNAKIDLVQFTDEYEETYINSVARLAQHWMHEFMNTERISFDDLEICVRLEKTKERLLESVRAYSIDKSVASGRQKTRPLLSFLKEPGEPTLFLYAETKGSVLEELPLRAIKTLLSGETFMALHRSLYRDFFAFPTERTTFITWRPSMELEEVETFEIPRRPKIERRFAEPLRYFVNLLMECFWSSQAAREEQAEDNPKIRDYICLAELMENRILRGGLDFSTSEPEPQRDLLFRPVGEVALDMPVVSSMVKELSPLVIYLRYAAAPGDWLVIDEPEMNLHPEAQVRLVEFLAMLIYSGLHILVTTHSPYLVDHLVNLMKAAEHKDKETLREKFYLQSTEAFIPRGQVSVYLFENGTVRNILDEEGLVEWGTFGRVSDRIGQIYHELCK